MSLELISQITENIEHRDQISTANVGSSTAMTPQLWNKYLNRILKHHLNDLHVVSTSNLTDLPRDMYYVAHGVLVRTTTPIGREVGERLEYQYKRVAANDSHEAVTYALVMNKAFSAGEPAIAKDANCSYQYADQVLDGPFPEGEAAIATRAQLAYDYAVHILRGPFPEGEPAIFSDPEFADHYRTYITRRQQRSAAGQAAK